MEKVLMKNVAMDMLEAYVAEMKLSELSNTTIIKYVADINQWLSVTPETIFKSDILIYKEKMCKKYKASSVNSKIISINRYLKWLNFEELNIKTKKFKD